MTGYVADLSWKSGARDWKVRSTKVDYGSECVNKHTAKLHHVGSLYTLTYDTQKLKHKKKVVQKIKTRFMFKQRFFFLQKSCRLYNNVGKKYVQPGRPQMTIWRMRTACWITKATDRYSEYVILIAFPLRQWLDDRSWMSRDTYIACLV